MTAELTVSHVLAFSSLTHIAASNVVLVLVSFVDILDSDFFRSSSTCQFWLQKRLIRSKHAKLLGQDTFQTGNFWSNEYCARLFFFYIWLRFMGLVTSYPSSVEFTRVFFLDTAGCRFPLLW